MSNAAYLNLLASDELQERAKLLALQLKSCSLCPHECKVERKGREGFCLAGDLAVVSSYGPHFGEEACLVGERGSGTIFFGHCTLRCVYCQNHQLSFSGQGEEISDQKLAEIMLSLQNDYGCHNINLVSPTHFLANIVNAVQISAQEGLRLPLVYNTGGYERVETLKLLDGIVDIYMPDFKYSSNQRGEKYSGVSDYAERVKAALIEMDRQVGGLKVYKQIAQRGLLIRHLILPDGLADSKEILRFIQAELSHDVLVNLMGQYFPAHRAASYQELSRRISSREFQELISYSRDLEIRLCSD